MSQELPAISKELLDALNARFPERCPDIQDSEREIWVKAGQRNVIRLLMREFKNQNDNILGNQYVLK